MGQKPFIIIFTGEETKIGKWIHNLLLAQKYFEVWMNWWQFYITRCSCNILYGSNSRYTCQITINKFSSTVNNLWNSVKILGFSLIGYEIWRNFSFILVTKQRISKRFKCTQIPTRFTSVYTACRIDISQVTSNQTSFNGPTASL